MGKLVVGTFVTLDGVMQAPGGPEEDREGGFEHGGWLAPHFDESLGATMDEILNRPDALLLGRKTYDIFVSYWPQQSGSMAEKLNSVRKYVASRSLEDVDWNNATLIRGDLAEEVRKIKDQHGEVHVTGSGNLIQSLLKHDLVDEFQLLVFPVLIGTGKRLFGDGTIPRGLRLVDSKTSGSGVSIVRYERTGGPEYGTVGA
jgi:dihydrofolate reductase